MKIENVFLTKNPYSRPGTKIGKIKNIAVHYVGNTGSKAINNRNFFQNLANTHERYASSHFIIGLNGEILAVVPEDEIAYCTNSANSYALSVEFCHPLDDGKPLDCTRSSLVELCAYLCIKYQLEPKTALIRHYDVTKKACPLYYVNKPKDWDLFKSDVSELVKYLKALDILVHNKVMSSPDFWANESNNKELYIKNLCINIGSKLAKKPLSYKESINEMVKFKVIESPDFWLSESSKKSLYYKKLIINAAAVF